MTKKQKISNRADIIKYAQQLINQEIKALESLSKTLDKNFNRAVDFIYQAKGKVVISGVGKSGLIGRKIAATLSSLGTPAIFIHATEALHGDLGMIQKGDIVIAISYSGETAELINLVQILKQRKIKVIALTGRPESKLTQYANVVLDIGVREEADPLKLAPTSSTTATLVLGDALAVALTKKKEFTTENFAYFHPGGSLGKKLRAK